MTKREADDLDLSIRIWDEQYSSQEKGKPVGIQYPTEALVIYVSNLRKGRSLEGYFKDHGSEYSVKRGFSGLACEIGFGSTPNLRLLRDKGFSVVGLETSADAVARAKDHLDALNIKDIDLRVWTPYAIPFADNTFKLICGLGCIYYNLDMAAVVKEIHRTLEVGGKFIFSFFSDRHTYIRFVEPVAGASSPKIKKWAPNHPNDRIRGAQFWQPDSKEDLLSLFGAFKDVRVFTTESDQTPMFESWWYVCGEK